MDQVQKLRNQFLSRTPLTGFKTGKSLGIKPAIKATNEYSFSQTILAGRLVIPFNSKIVLKLIRKINKKNRSFYCGFLFVLFKV